MNTYNNIKENEQKKNRLQEESDGRLGIRALELHRHCLGPTVDGDRSLKGLGFRV